MYLAQACLLFFDTLAWIYRGNTSEIGYYLVRISNAAVYHRPVSAFYVVRKQQSAAYTRNKLDIAI